MANGSPPVAGSAPAPSPPSQFSSLRAPLHPKQPSPFTVSTQPVVSNNSNSNQLSSSDFMVIASSIIVMLTVFCGCIGVIRGVILWMQKREELEELLADSEDLSPTASGHTRSLREVRRERRRNRFRESAQRRLAFANRNKKGLTRHRISELGGVFEYPAEGEKAGEMNVEECDVECPVCLDTYQAGEPLRNLQVCGHVFHQECLDSWLEIHGSCPLCRKRAYVCPHKSDKVTQQQVEAPLDSVTVEVSYSFLDTPAALVRNPSVQRGSEGVGIEGDADTLQLPAVRWTVVRVGSSRRSLSQASPARVAGRALSLGRGESEGGRMVIEDVSIKEQVGMGSQGSVQSRSSSPRSRTAHLSAEGDADVETATSSADADQQSLLVHSAEAQESSTDHRTEKETTER